MSSELCECGCGNPAPIAKQTSSYRGRVKGQPLRFINGHNRGNRSHGLSRSQEWYAYSGAKQRCSNKNNKDYSDYGGRGIKFLFKSFEQFINAVGRKPSPGLMLDRINNNGHYAPGNVRWATKSVSSKNRRFRKVQVSHKMEV